ncbi:hypothetical protein [Flavobacterium sp.]|uniref:hypothetical protein n=1 Tax=Flavobacterium sp. TaxID=239 RepID=UPI00404817E4
MGKNKKQKSIILIILNSFLVFFSSCNKEAKKNLELVILNNELVTYAESKDSINFIRFSLKNNSDKIYFINGSNNQKILSKGIQKMGITLKIFNENGKEVEYYPAKQPTALENNCSFEFIRNYNKFTNINLGYNPFKYDYFKLNNLDKTFFIYPKQTIYFEYSLNLNRTLMNDEDRNKYVKLDPNKNYSAVIILESNSKLIDSNLPWNYLQSIEANQAEVYNGIIESSNKIPVKVLNLY